MCAFRVLRGTYIVGVHTAIVVLYITFITLTKTRICGII